MLHLICFGRAGSHKRKIRQGASKGPIPQMDVWLREPSRQPKREPIRKVVQKMKIVHRKGVPCSRAAGFFRPIASDELYASDPFSATARKNPAEAKKRKPPALLIDFYLSWTSLKFASACNREPRRRFGDTLRQGAVPGPARSTISLVSPPSSKGFLPCCAS
jgi:hypothetical protein